MKNHWSEKDAKAMIRHYARAGVNSDRALRVYTSRLLGNEPKLVLHGGGNTSVKTVMKDVMGAKTDVLCVKGSGWDMGDIEPQGLPAVRLDNLRQLIALDRLSDEEMVNAQRANLLDSAAPNPSVETLLHAFLPHKFIDHTHSNAVLSLTDQPGGDALCHKVFGKKMGYVPYIMPGFALAKKAFDVFQQDPSVEGLILFKHGIFTFGETAKQAYSRMIDHVTLAEKRLAKGRKKIFVAAKLPKKIAAVADVAPILRGLVSEPGQSEGSYKRMVLDFRTSAAILAFVGGKDLKRYSQQGTATPDHVIRTKQKPLIVPAPETNDLEGFAKGAEKALAAYHKAYHSYFGRQNKIQGPKTELDPMPRLILVPGLGLFGLGANAKAATIAADLAETNVEVITGAERLSSYQVISEHDIFEIEYWGLEQAKLGKGVEKPLARQVCVVSGGGSGIGAATARAFAAQGCEVAVLDLHEKAALAVAGKCGGFGLACDVTSAKSVNAAMNKVAARYGGVDIVVSNAGAAWQGRIGDVADKVLRQSFELNFWGHQNLASKAVAIMRAQGTGGCLLFNTSKQAINPGPNFGPYGLPKAATLFLMRQYAVDHGAEGIRANAVNADRIRSGLLSGSMIQSRSKARGLSEKDYMSGNLLGREVLAEDVAQAFVDLAVAEKTTASVTTVDGGNIAAALR
jgi:rhamnose utilization protein RhaD (predicted bifunctional aldolase and dehydrogenase)/NAD(P)-dependent dehydrogenase (short-subunit alcohol dehydrogenase family)